ncbi:hypothetical protein D9611_013462 [Ephemerocybe angulata]|uniref:F-box domain-containing protein n=1 Tax=Ephemerocybe angulata TaxID=980116 RepID=A0A8H5BTC6_9AGAR|nr:hypothetical protein D9611_013462 [Tulosesus angulatus]
MATVNYQSLTHTPPRSGASGGFEHGIHKLPNETLAQIFLSGSLTLSTNPGRNGSPAFNLLLVSRHWNALASSLPSLWTTLDLDLYSLEKDRRGAEAEIILWRFAKLCLSRASKQGLHITLCGPIQAPMENLARLGATSDRWASLNLCSAKALTHIINDRKNFSGFPKLRSLEMHVRTNVCWDNFQVVPADDEDDLLPLGGPDLGTLELAHFYLRLHLSSQSSREAAEGIVLALPNDLRSSVTHLLMEKCDHPGMLSARMRKLLTAGMGSLTHLHLELPSIQLDPEATMPTLPGHLTLPHITYLSISSLSCQHAAMRDDVWRNLDYLIVPSLKHLRIVQILPEEEGCQTNAYVTRILSRGQRIQTLATQQVSLKHSIALIEALRPEKILISNAFNSPTIRGTLSKFVEHLIEAKPLVAQVRVLVIHDRVLAGTLLTRDIVKTLGLIKRTHPSTPNPRNAAKTIVLCSQVDIPSDTLRDYEGVGDHLSEIGIELGFRSMCSLQLPQQWWLTGLESWN